MEQENYYVIERDDPAYPELLRQLDTKAPKRLWCCGDLSLLEKRCAAVVGSRKPSQYGKWVAAGAGKLLAKHDVVTVSGMAMGCDSEAHKGALSEGGKTIAVLGCGIDICYPKRSVELRKKIIQNGLLVTEFSPGSPPAANHFPQRNRIISGLSEVTVVAEASMASGSLITAGFAAEQGREVLAAPGNIANPCSIGCNKLIQDGVTPLVCLDDILRTMGIRTHSEPMERRLALGRDERQIYEFVRKNNEVSVDELSLFIGKKSAEIQALVTVMEIKGYLETSMGKIMIGK